MKVSIAALSDAGAAFGTSGVRGLVDALTDQACFAYTAAFLERVVQRSPRRGEQAVAAGHDLRPSSPRIVAACVAACEAHGFRPVLCGALPTPALAHYAMQQGIPAIMVTGSHIPFDRNGIKFYTAAGEILKDDETAIAEASVEVDDSAFDARRMLRDPRRLPEVEPTARDLYRDRYRRFFRAGLLTGKRVGVYEHSSVGRDLLGEVLRDLGAEVVSLGRTDTFVPVDTEAISDSDERLVREWVTAHGLDALVSTDGDSDRPLLADEAGELFRGDVLGILCARFLGARTVVTPVSSNTGVERCGDFARVVRTRIGSPYVIAAMIEAARTGEAPVVGYEANGGFLLGSAVHGAHASLAPLPTRDAVLPILSLLAAAAERGGGLSALRSSLPPRFTASDRLKDFPSTDSRRLLDHLAVTPGALAAFFAALGPVADVNRVDGARATLRSGEIVHLRPSGNAPELRCYAEADTQARAVELSQWGLRAALESQAP